MTTADYLMQPSEAAPSASAAPAAKKNKTAKAQKTISKNQPVVLDNLQRVDTTESFKDDIKKMPSLKPAPAAPQPAPKAPSTPYQNLVRMLYPEQEAKRYAAEQEALNRKRKRDAAISALGDGIAALSNLYTVSRGAQNIDVSSNTMSDKSRERYDKINAERDARKDAYRNAMLNAAMRDRAEQIDADRVARANDLAAQQQAEQTRQFEETMRYNRERDDKLYANKEADRQLKSAQFEERMRVAWAKAYKSAHGGGGKSGSGNNVIKGYPLTLKNGKTVYYANETAWKYAYGKEYPEDPLYDESHTQGSSENQYGEKTSNTKDTRKRSSANKAGARAANGGLGKAPGNL